MAAPPHSGPCRIAVSGVGRQPAAARQRGYSECLSSVASHFPRPHPLHVWLCICRVLKNLAQSWMDDATKRSNM